MGIASGGVVAVAMTIVILIGGQQVFAGKLTFGALLVFITYIQNFFRPVDNLISSFVSMKQSSITVGRVYEILAEDLEHKDNGNQEKPNFEHALEFRNVYISYPSAPPIQNINFKILKGEKVGLFGPSGSGKSTLLAACSGQLPYSGNILIDGVELSSISASSKTSLISVVSQNPMLFTDTILNNITFGIDNYTETDVIAALKNAGAYEFVNSLPQGPQTVIGESVIAISGGEAQRLAIARALIRKPKILILDEPTSALDIDAEREIIRTLFEKLEYLTVLFVTHKPLFLWFMDQVIITENGTATNVENLGGLETYLGKGPGA